MKNNTESTSLRFARSLAAGVLLSMFLLYSVHVLGKWTIEEYRPDPETTSTTLLHNTCAIFSKTHTLRPNTDVSGLGDGIDGTKLTGSFMNFSDGHVISMIVIAIMSGSLIFLVRNRAKIKSKLIL